MSNKLGKFEIVSEITHSSNGSVYKANDTENNQTVALKTLRLAEFGEAGARLVERVLEEAANCKVLNSHNVAVLYSAEQIDNQFCAALEYVQGNSIATMLARKEGFSIWDLQDIARQTCQGLDHAHAKGVFHYSLEPAKIMVTWDGTVKILGFGISAMSAFASQAAGTAPEVLYYMPPEQLHGDPLDARSNIFSLGAILYEMVTERKPFPAEDADGVRAQILEQAPAPPLHVVPKVHPALSEVIMKALAKNADERYQSGQDLVNDLERCKESPTKAATTVAAKKVTAPTATPKSGLHAASTPVTASERDIVKRPAATSAAQSPDERCSVAAQTTSAPDTAPTARAKAAVAAAGWSGVPSSPVAKSAPAIGPATHKPENPVSEVVTNMSAAAAEPEVETPEVKTPKIAVDPMMADAPADRSATVRSFSEIDELPPLKDAYVPPAPVAPEPEPEPESAKEIQKAVFRPSAKEDKPKVQARDVAKKAVGEIKKTPPKFFMYSTAAAIGVILLIVVAIAFRIHSENGEDDSAPSRTTRPAAAVTTTQATPAPAATQPAPPQAAPTTSPLAAPEPPIEQQPAVSVRSKPLGRKKSAKAVPAPAPAIVPGQLAVNSTPEGAQVHVDGQTDPSWMTPYNLAGLAPGQHTVTVSKPGFSSETRTLDVASGSKSFLVVQLAQLTATLSIDSTPSGAELYLDGKATGKSTPLQISVEKAGTHSLTLKKQGYLDESSSANLQIGQTFHFAPTLRALGNTTEIKTVSKLKKVFGGGGGDAAGMGVVSIKTNPKGAQIAVNRRIVDKTSPVDFYLNPGTYVIDISLSGFKDVHRVINVDKSGKVVIDESMERE